MIALDLVALLLMFVYLTLLFWVDNSEEVRFLLALVLMGLCLWLGFTAYSLWLLTAGLWLVNALIDLVKILRS